MFKRKTKENMNKNEKIGDGVFFLLFLFRIFGHLVKDLLIIVKSKY